MKAPVRWSSVPAALVLTAALLLAAGCGSEEEPAAGPAGAGRPAGHPGGAEGGGPPARPAVPVAVERAELGSAASYYTTTATLEASNRAEVLSRTTGVVRQLRREEGDRVQAGDLLLRLEDDEALLRVQQAEANFRLAQAEFDRRQQMLEGGLLSAGEFETTQSNLQVRESELGLARVALQHTQVRAPFAGTVVLRHVDLGANVNPGSPLFELMDITPLLAKVYIPAKRMGFVVEGQAMEILLDSVVEPVIGVVTLVSPIVDSSTGTVKVTAEVKDYPSGTRPGDFAEVRIVTDRHDDAVLVPSLAMFEEQGEDIVYVVEDAKAVRKVVVGGFVDGDVTEIESGLDPGEVVVVKGQRQLKDGGAVEVLEGPEDLVAQAAAAAEAAEADGAADADGKPEQDAS